MHSVTMRSALLWLNSRLCCHGTVSTSQKMVRISFKFYPHSHTSYFCCCSNFSLIKTILRSLLFLHFQRPEWVGQKTIYRMCRKTALDTQARSSRLQIPAASQEEQRLELRRSCIVRRGITAQRCKTYRTITGQISSQSRSTKRCQASIHRQF